MPDFLVRDIEPQVADRIKRIARERGWPINDVILRLIKEALGMVQPDAPVPGDIARLAGTFEDDESRALAEAMKAMQSLPDDTPY
ncbi:hypothetical protein [Denitratimonas sp. CY0512]|uniref:hypothetical protein n=1 Tax=Denitratimonas sp. CY0512 TaxID=3131940 RepID=UPI0016B7CF7A|nr:hypothetical protein [Gammaproteobacteria bacterium]